MSDHVLPLLQSGLQSTPTKNRDLYGNLTRLSIICTPWLPLLPCCSSDIPVMFPLQGLFSACATHPPTPHLQTAHSAEQVQLWTLTRLTQAPMWQPYSTFSTHVWILDQVPFLYYSFVCWWIWMWMSWTTLQYFPVTTVPVTLCASSQCPCRQELLGQV